MVLALEERFLNSLIFKKENSSSGVQIIQVMSNQEAVDIARRIKDPMKAAKQLTAEALKRESKDDISCVVVRFSHRGQ